MHLSLHRFLIPLLAIVATNVGSHALDYCKADLCRNNLPHVGCNPPKPFGRKCTGMQPKVVLLSQELRSYIVSLHNKLRAKLAAGKLSRFPPAVRMPTLTWDTQLANLAGDNARSCVFAHDRCRNTAAFKYAGQNIAIQQHYNQKFTAKQLVKEFVLAWWKEYKNATAPVVDKYPANYTGPVIGHWTQLANDRTWKVGCALMNWLADRKWITNYFVCNYSFTNVINQPVYTRGRSASKCTKGKHQRYKSLCAKGEPIKSTA